MYVSIIFGYIITIVLCVFEECVAAKDSNSEKNNNGK